MQVEIVHQDSEMLVINKPPDMVVNRAESVTGLTVQDWVDTQFDYELAHDAAARNGVVHRLDKNTSGIMVLAKTAEAMSELQRQFHDRETKKTYLALVHGKFGAEEGTISVPMERSKFDRKRFVVGIGGRMTETHYKVLHYYERLKDRKKMAKGYQGFSLVELHPKTGRTHQIRVIMTHLKHPLVGDEMYVGRKRARADMLWCSRQFLHAQQLCLHQPKTKEPLCFEAPLPIDLQAVLAELE